MVKLPTDSDAAASVAVDAVAGDYNLEKPSQRLLNVPLLWLDIAEQQTVLAAAAVHIRTAVVEHAAELPVVDSFAVGADRFEFLAADCLASGDDVVVVEGVVVEPLVEQRFLDLDSKSHRTGHHVLMSRTLLD